MNFKFSGLESTLFTGLSVALHIKRMGIFKLKRQKTTNFFSVLSQFGHVGGFAIILIVSAALGSFEAQSSTINCSSFYGMDTLKLRILKSIVNQKNGQKEILGNVMYEVNPRAWEIASSDPQYLLKAEELRLLDTFLKELQPEHIVEFGPGDGSKATRILKESSAVAAYTGVDINSEMISLAYNRMTDSLRGIKDIVLSFEKPLDLEQNQRSTRKIKSGFQKVLGLFLGQTLGNPPPEKRQTVLKNMARLLPPHSTFITGVALKPQSTDMIEKNLRSYSIGDYNQLIMGPLKYLGLDNAGKLKIVWNEKENNVEAIFTFDRAIHLENGVSIVAGEEVLLFRSHRFTVDEIKELWSLAGFTDLEIILSEGFPYALVKAQIK